MEKQTIYCSDWPLSEEEDEKEKSGFSFSSFDLSLADLTTGTGREVETAIII